MSTGKRNYVVQDPISIDMLLALVDRLETLEGIRSGLDDMNAGRTISLEAVRDKSHRDNAIPG